MKSAFYNSRRKDASVAATTTLYRRFARVLQVLLPGLLFGLSLFSTGAHAEEFRGYSQPFVYTDAKTPATDIPFTDVDGNLQRLSDFRGQVVLVNFWASWCSACIVEMPELNALQKALGDKGLKVLTLNQDLNDGSAAHQFLLRRGHDALTGHLDINYLFGQAFGQKLLPMTLLFDTNGRQIGQLVGAADWNSTSAQALIGNYLPK